MKLTDFLSYEIVQPLVDCRTGEIAITVGNPTKGPIQGINLALREGGTSAAPVFSVIPSSEDGGYTINAIAPQAHATRRFCVTPIHAEVGHRYVMQVVATFSLEDEAYRYALQGKRRQKPRGTASGLAADWQDQAPFHVVVEARPEVYAAIGAVESMRRRMLKTYDHLIDTGKKAQDAQTTLPGGLSVDPARLALSEGSFKFILDALEVGARMMNIPAERVRRESRAHQARKPKP